MIYKRKDGHVLTKIEYIKDEEFKYNEEIKKGLKAYNASQTGYREKDKHNFYVFENDELCGVCYAKLTSDWCFIKKIYYENIDVLKELLNNVYEYYGDKIIGMQFHSVIPARVEDFKKLGFIEKGKLKDMPNGGENVFLINTELINFKTKKDYDTQLSREPINPYNEILKKENHILRKSLNFSSEVVDTQFVVLDNGKFVGGIYGNYQYDYLFINILFVKATYRGKRIATTLMNLIEAEAYKKGIYNLYLTTFEFQALGFYKKRGYKVVIIIEDYPKGFKEYTVYKKLH